SGARGLPVLRNSQPPGAGLPQRSGPPSVHERETGIIMSGPGVPGTQLPCSLPRSTSRKPCRPPITGSMRSPGQSRFFSLLALAGLACLAVRLGGLREWGLPTILLGSVALVSGVLLIGAARSLSERAAARRIALDLTAL